MAAPATIDDFLDVVRKSNQVDTGRLETYLAQHRGDASWPSEPKKLAQLLVRDGVLTTFQAEQFLQGKYRGFTLGGYRLIERLGAGGTGTVFLAEHEVMKRRVALKILSPGVAGDPSVLERFRREAQAAGALDHPNIVRAYDFRQEGQLHVLVMEYVAGPSLQQVIESTGPMSVPVACEYVRQAAIGLQHAHDAGLVHRDIKPANLLVDGAGVVKILDMGLARFSPEGQESLTKKFDENMVMGTADYLAPEQAINLHNVDSRADIYSLGATLYALLAGEPPFPQGTVTQKLLWHQLKDPVRLDQRSPHIPADVADIVVRMMEKDPEVRLQSCLEVAEALTPFSSTTPTPQSPLRPGGHGKVGTYVRASTVPGSSRKSGPLPPGPANNAVAAQPVSRKEDADEEDDLPRRRHRDLDVRKAPEDPSGSWVGILLLLGVMFFVLLLVGGVLAFLIWGPSPTAKSTATGTAPDLVEVEKPHPVPPIAPVPSAGPATIPLPGPGQTIVLAALPAAMERVAYSPQPGRNVVASGSDGLVHQWDVLTRQQIGLSQGPPSPPMNWVAFNKTANRLLSAGADGMARLWALPGFNELKRFTGHTGRVWAAVFGTDDNEVLTAGEDGTVRVWDARNNNPPRVLTGHSGAVTWLAYRPGAKRHQVLSAGADGTLRLWDLDAKLPVQPAKEAPAVQVFQGHKGRVHSVAFNNTGAQAISGGDDRTVRLWQIDGKPEGITLPGGHQGAVRAVAVSADGGRRLTGGADQKIILWDLNTRQQIRAFGPPQTHSASVTGLAFSPDGHHFASCGEDKTVRITGLPAVEKENPKR